MNHQILAKAFYKTLSDINCEPKVVLAWAVSAKNTLQTNGGFSPNQVV